MRSLVLILVCLLSISGCDEPTAIGTPGDLRLRTLVLPPVEPAGGTVVVKVSAINDTDRTVYLRSYCPIIRFEVRNAADEVVFRGPSGGCGYIGEAPDTVVAPGEGFSSLTMFRTVSVTEEGEEVPLPPGLYMVLPLMQPEPGSVEWQPQGTGDQLTLEPTGS